MFRQPLSLIVLSRPSADIIMSAILEQPLRSIDSTFLLPSHTDNVDGDVWSVHTPIGRNVLIDTSPRWSASTRTWVTQMFLIIIHLMEEWLWRHSLIASKFIDFNKFSHISLGLWLDTATSRMLKSRVTSHLRINNVCSLSTDKKIGKHSAVEFIRLLESRMIKLNCGHLRKRSLLYKVVVLNCWKTLVGMTDETDTVGDTHRSSQKWKVTSVVFSIFDRG